MFDVYQLGEYPSDRERIQSKGEEIANTISHGLGLGAAVVGAPYLLLRTMRDGDPWLMFGASVFAGTTILLYLASTLYHALPPGRTKRLFRVLEHSAIFLLIAGTCTPFALGVLHGPWGWSIFGVIWAIAAVGVTMKALGRASHPGFSIGLYVSMGWVIMIAIKPLIDGLPRPGLVWLVSGGLFYTAGVGFFATDSRLRYGHLIWHLFVLAGTACHYVAILLYGG